MKLLLPYPPSVNHYWQRSRNGGMHIGAPGVAFRNDVANICAASGIKGSLLRDFTGTLVELRIVLYPPDRRRRDIDNVLKSLNDSLQHAGVFADDSQVAKITIERGAVIAGGACEVTISIYHPRRKTK